MEPLNNFEYKASSVLILGTKRCGKTTYSVRYIDKYPGEVVVVYDWQGGEIAHRVGGHLVDSRDALAEKLDDGEVKVICYNAEVAEKDPKGEGFEWFCHFCFEALGQFAGSKLVVVDELQDLITSHDVPEALLTLLTRGGRRQIDTLLVASQSNAIHNQCRNQITEIVVFRTLDENALKYPAALGMEIEEIKALPDCRFLHKSCRTGDQKKLDLWEKTPSTAQNKPKPKEK
jgi:NADH/NAD ratio-sensing transcriptional regulator Rex